jgi:shikimate dehydrogenase
MVARRPPAARALKARLPTAQRARVTVAPWSPEALGVAVGGAAAVVSAVPAAAWGEPSAREGLGSLTPGTAVLEMAYGATTPLSRAVRARVRRYADGLGMLVHQAARAVELAVGKPPPVAPLFRAARDRKG